MAVTFTQPADSRAFSVGGSLRVEIFDGQAQTGDTSIVCTFDSLSQVDQAMLMGVVCTAKSISGNVATFTISNPLATVQFSVIGFGR